MMRGMLRISRRIKNTNSGRVFLGISSRTCKRFTTVSETNMVLEGSCECGASGWKAHGCSSVNFVCHCSLCRSSSKQNHVSAAGFQMDQISWVNSENISKSIPKGSRNTRMHCSKCKSYMGEDASDVLGIVALSLSTCKDVPQHYLPNHHIFYQDRVEDVSDSLPKWKSFPQGEIFPSDLKSRNPIPVPGRDPDFGSLFKDVLPLSPTRPPYARNYTFTESDPVPNHTTKVNNEMVQIRRKQKYYPSPEKFQPPTITERDVIIIGGGHNGLVTSAYLAKKGLDVLVLERRHCVGGAAVTEEIFPGYKFSRASYLAGLLRPQVIKDLELEKYGFKYISRDPSSFTPTKEKGKYLLLQSDDEKTCESIAQFSVKDAEAFPKYEAFLNQVREIVSPALDGPPPNPLEGKLSDKLNSLRTMYSVSKAALRNKDALVPLYELFSAPAAHLLDRWFESEILKTTLATDAVIGAMSAPSQPTSAYVLLHHVMGEADGRKGVWAYIEGGMGAVSEAIAQSSRESGTEILTNASVKEILYEQPGDDTPPKATGVLMEDGTVIKAKVVVSNATPYHTFLELIPGFSPDSPLPEEFSKHVRFTDYSCGAFKINCAIESLPNFICCPNKDDGPQPHHRGTIHFETKMQELEDAFREASMGIPATRPVIEMTIPSSLDPTVAPEGKHVCQLFIQFAPYDVDPKVGSWADPSFKNAFADRVFSIIDEFAPGFSESVIHRDVLSPLDLEKIFGLHKGNIFHGSLSPHQLGYARPAPGFSSHRTPISSLYLCGAGTHPGGGVMGAPGRNCASVILNDLSK